jgi:hypothetical protein
MDKLIGDENVLRDRLLDIMKNDPHSIREYTRRLQFGKDGNAKTLSNFLYKARKSTFLTLLKIKNYVELNEK